MPYQEIHKAAAEGDVDTIRRLLEDGVDPSIENIVSMVQCISSSSLICFIII